MEILGEKEAIYDDGLKTFYSSLPDKTDENDIEGGAKKPFQRVLFRDKDYIQLNRSANVLIYLFSEAIKEINDTEYTPNNENFKPNEKQTYIINLLKRFKDYVENYNKYSLQELKNKLNQLNNDFLKQLDEETRTLLLRKCVSKIYKIRDKVLPKNQDFKKLFETIYPTITDEEADKLNNKTVKPIQDVLNSIKIIQPIQQGLKPLQIKPDKKTKAPKIPLTNSSIIKNFAHNKLDDKTIDLFKNAFIGNDIKLNDYCDIDKKNILEFKKLVDEYVHKLDEYNKSKTDADKSFVQGQIMHYKNELTKKYMELQDINKYINFFLNSKRDFDKINQAYTLSKNKFFEGDALNDVSGLHNDSEFLRVFETYTPIYNNYLDDFKKLSIAEQNHIKDNIFKDKLIFDEEISKEYINQLRNEEIKAYISFFMDDFKFVYSIVNNEDYKEEFKPLKVDINQPITKSKLINRNVEEIKDREFSDLEMKQYYFLSLYLQNLEAELNLIHENPNIQLPFIQVYNNDIDPTFKLILKAFDLTEQSNYNDLLKYIHDTGEHCIEEYNRLTGEMREGYDEKEIEIDEALLEDEERERKEMEELNRRIEEELKNSEQLKAIIRKVQKNKELTDEEDRIIKRFYEDKFDELKRSNPNIKKISKKIKKEMREQFLKHIKELIEQQKELNEDDDVVFDFDDDEEFPIPLSKDTINAEEGNGKFDKVYDKKLYVSDKLINGGALFDSIKTKNYKNKINLMENIYNKFKNLLEDELDVKLNSKLPDLTAIVYTKTEEPKGKGKKECLKGGEIEPLKTTKEKDLPFNPPQKSIKERVNMIKEKKQLRNARISNFNRTQIRNSLNTMNNNNLYPSLDSINPEFLKNLSGNGTFLKDQINNHISYIKKKANKI